RKVQFCRKKEIFFSVECSAYIFSLTKIFTLCRVHCVCRGLSVFYLKRFVFYILSQTNWSFHRPIWVHIEIYGCRKKCKFSNNVVGHKKK
ncbi:hypothetical protein VIGAN_05221600, partial [Vigna angularis var. angularis]